MLVAVQGRIHNSKWTDGEGIEHYNCETVADDVQFLSRPRQLDPGEGSEPQSEMDDDPAF